MGMVARMKTDLIVVGGGAAGMMAAGRAAELGAKVILLEKTPSLGNKLRISGKGRCNLTNASDISDFPEMYPGHGKFLLGALHRFTNWDLVDFFEELGVSTKVERGGRIFPASDRAEAVVDALVRYLASGNVDVRCRTKVRRILTGQREGELAVQGVELEDKRLLYSNQVLIATGGLSYPGTGSTGDGFCWAAEVGHTVVPPKPALVPLKVGEVWVKELAGLSLKNVTATLLLDGRAVQSEFGEMLFTHFGVSGPIILTLSREAVRGLASGRKVGLSINLKPALSEQKLDERLQRDFQKYSRKQFKNGLDDLLPKRLIPIVIGLSGIDPEKPVHQVTKEERKKLGSLLQALPLSVTDSLGISAAIVTAGGVATDEIDPRSMESRLVKGLYFAGEIIDVDGVTGGYNLQAAFSTARCAAEAIARKLG